MLLKAVEPPRIWFTGRLYGRWRESIVSEHHGANEMGDWSYASVYRQHQPVTTLKM